MKDAEVVKEMLISMICSLNIFKCLYRYSCCFLSVQNDIQIVCLVTSQRKEVLHHL